MADKEAGVSFKDVMDFISKVIDAAGVGVIIIGSLLATTWFVKRVLAKPRPPDAYRLYRADVGNSILMGLEFLIAGDIIRTVAVNTTFTSVGVLAILVVVRSFLSIELQMEIDGYWPWQRNSLLSQQGKGGG